MPLLSPQSGFSKTTVQNQLLVELENKNQ